MSRRSYKVLTVSVQFPVPAGSNQKKELELLRETLRERGYSEQTIIKLLKAETVYL